MTRSLDDLGKLARDPGFIPKTSDISGLLKLLTTTDSEDDAKFYERALVRRDLAVLSKAMNEVKQNPRRIIRLVGRIAADSESREPAILTFLKQGLDSSDERVRRVAISALAKLKEFESDIARLWVNAQLPEKRAIARALGRFGTPSAESALDSFGRHAPDDPELQKLLGESLRHTRQTQFRLDLDEEILTSCPLPILSRVRWHCRQGLGRWLKMELAEFRPKALSENIFEAKTQACIQEIAGPRIALYFGFGLPVDGAPTKSNVDSRVQALVSAVGSPEGRAIFLGLTKTSKDRIRYRIEWEGLGHQRLATRNAAELIGEKFPFLLNDPTDTTWQIIATCHEDTLIDVELRPNRWSDPRFSYRVEDVEGASHPTISAALARVAGVRTEDVVWDPFMGAGTELIERALLGPYRSLYGSDVDPKAVFAAKSCLKFAKIDATIVASDFRECRPPEPVSLVITNPPMGHRVLHRDDLEPLFESFFAHMRACIRRDGRIVMLSPLPRETALIGDAQGMNVLRQTRVEVANVLAELQVFSLKRRTR